MKGNILTLTASAAIAFVSFFVNPKERPVQLCFEESQESVVMRLPVSVVWEKNRGYVTMQGDKELLCKVMNQFIDDTQDRFNGDIDARESYRKTFLNWIQQHGSISVIANDEYTFKQWMNSFGKAMQQ